MSLYRNSVSSGGGGSSAPTMKVSHLSEGAYTLASPLAPNVSGNLVDDITPSLTSLYGSGHTSGAGIALTAGSFCIITTSCMIDNIVGQSAFYFEVINAADNTKRYVSRNMVVNKVDSENADTVTFDFMVTAEMASDGVIVALTAHKGTSGNNLYGFIHTIIEHL